LIFKSEDGSVLAGVIGPGRNRAPVGFEVTYGEAGFIVRRTAGFASSARVPGDGCGRTLDDDQQSITMVA
jgi:hypothetical protein